VRERYSIRNRRKSWSTSVWLIIFPKDWLRWMIPFQVPQIRGCTTAWQARKIDPNMFRLPRQLITEPQRQKSSGKKVNQVFLSCTRVGVKISEGQVVWWFADREWSIKFASYSKSNRRSAWKLRISWSARTVLVTTLTKRMAEDLTEYLQDERFRLLSTLGN